MDFNFYITLVKNILSKLEVEALDSTHRDICEAGAAFIRMCYLTYPGDPKAIYNAFMTWTDNVKDGDIPKAIALEEMDKTRSDKLFKRRK